MITLLKRSKQIYFASYFQTNINDRKNTCKCIKNLTSFKKWLNSIPSAVIENSVTLTNPQLIAAAFKKCFVNILSSVDPQSIMKASCILSLNPLKAGEPNSIPKKVLQLLYIKPIDWAI